ncbi:hypothetical protein MMA231_03854 (plasmid) [Asticcacaulis sp. MM231]
MALPSCPTPASDKPNPHLEPGSRLERLNKLHNPIQLLRFYRLSLTGVQKYTESSNFGDTKPVGDVGLRHGMSDLFRRQFRHVSPSTKASATTVTRHSVRPGDFKSSGSEALDSAPVHWPFLAYIQAASRRGPHFGNGSGSLAHHFSPRRISCEVNSAASSIASILSLSIPLPMMTIS